MSKKKILIFSDDLRMSSGVGTMTKEMVMGTIIKDVEGLIFGKIKQVINNSILFRFSIADLANI